MTDCDHAPTVMQLRCPCGQVAVDAGIQEGYKRGGPKAPYTTGYINTEELHFVKRLAPRRPEGSYHVPVQTEWEMECGRIGSVTELKDRTAAEVLAIEEICQGCVTALWVGELTEEAVG